MFLRKVTILVLVGIALRIGVARVVEKAMFLTKLKIATAVSLMLAMVGVGAWGIGSVAASAKLTTAKRPDAAVGGNLGCEGMLAPSTAAASFAVNDEKGGARKTASGDEKLLQGTWEVVELVKEGETVLPAHELNGKVVIEGNKFRFILTPKGKDELVRTAALMKLDPSKSPKSIDATIVKGATELGSEGKVALGIYEIAGENLKLCLADPGAERPDSFTAEKGTSSVLFKLKRVSKKREGPKDK